MKITAKYIHDACHEACMQCPQFREIDDDCYFPGWGNFGDIPKKGIHKTILFWSNDELLWSKGYSAELPDDVKRIFKDIDKVIADAIANYCKGL
jgi:hypothetical protein